MHGFFRLTLLSALAAALAVLLGNAVVAHLNITRLAESDGRVAHTLEVHDALDLVLSTLQDAETGQRGFLLVGRPDYLAPYEDARRQLPERLANLRRLAEQSEGRRPRLDELEQHVGEKMAELQKTIDLSRDPRKGRAAALRVVETGRGKEAMDAARRVIGEIRQVEDERLRSGTALALQSRSNAVGANILGTFLGVSTVLLASYFFMRDVRLRERSRAELRQANARLEQRVRERTAELAKANTDLRAEVEERTRAEARVQTFAAELQRSNRELQEFASVASHDLQEPLHKIQAFGDRLQAKCKDGLSDQGLEYLGRMLDSAGRMRALIDDLLTFSRVATKPQAHARVDLGAVARGVVSDLEARLQQTGGRVEVGELPALEAEPTQMRQLIQNLIGNALKFHRPEVPPLVRVAGEVTAEPLVRLTVADNGIGFDEKYLDRIFGVFQRLHGRGKYEGNGMGLAICRKIVEQHGGQITARSQPGAGTTFIVTLPLQKPSAEGPSA